MDNFNIIDLFVFLTAVIDIFSKSNLSFFRVIINLYYLRISKYLEFSKW